jgi:hypothetical protein
VDEESRRRGSVCDHAVCPDAEHSMGHLLVGGDPAARILLPTELGEGGIEAGAESRQHDLAVEVSDSLRRCCHRTSSTLPQYVLYQI